MRTIEEGHAWHARRGAELAEQVLRDGARAWFSVGKVSPCNFFIDGELRMEFLARIATYAAGKFKIKVAVMGPDSHDTLRVLNRSIKWTCEGIVHESDHRMRTG